MTTNYEMTQSSTTKALESVYFPAPLKSNSLSQPSLTTYELGSTPKRMMAWQVAPNLFISFRYAWAGVCYAFTTQRNFRIHTAIATIAITAGLYLNVSAVEMSILTLTCALVMVLELLNTALESLVDLSVGQTYHELAKVAKDCAAGAVLISSLAALLVASFIILPSLVALVL